ncbi:MAG TPA: glycoside hydrolase family 2 TIM barrel-domain containing protein, partial [Victivallales bacterium]|nr:glycoside hydrolase family 2 TIM barrel-domain containing protein [Victivallales bacterium]
MNNEQLKIPSEDSYASAKKILGSRSVITAEWSPSRAPGFSSSPEKGTRKFYESFCGWTKLTVSSKYEDIEGGGVFVNTLLKWTYFPLPSGEGGETAVFSEQTLPDQWDVSRNYHHAWYFLDIDFGNIGSKELWLRFDAVSHSCTAFVNGKKAGSHIGGYTPFEFNISQLLQSGKNTIALFVVDDVSVIAPIKKSAISQLDAGRGVHNAHFAGIRGGVYFEAREKVHVSRVRVRTSTRKNRIDVETWLRGGSSAGTLKQEVFEWPNGSSPVLKLPDISFSDTSSGSACPLNTGLSWSNPKLWSPEHPNLYVLRSTLICGEKSETVETRFGFREFWIEGKQFMLNGKPIRLFGDGSHLKEFRSILPWHSIEFGRKSFEYLKREFNFMSARLHGVTFPHWTIFSADEAGILITNQNGLRSGESKMYDAGKEEFMRNMELQTEEWYWRDVNSPSVVIWDVDNELIRGYGRGDSERMKWVLKLDDFIRKFDPEAIIEHSGAAYYKPDQQIIHVHMQEQYSRVMREWNVSGKVPLVMGEFWMGGRGETRLPNSYEYSDREDWHREEARLYREHMLQMRYFGVSGIMPHRLTRWPLIATGPLLTREDVLKMDEEPYQWRFNTVRAEGGRGIAPVIVFAWPRTQSVPEGKTFEREIVVCNDSEGDRELQVNCEYGKQKHAWNIVLKPAEQKRFSAVFSSEAGNFQLKSEVLDKSGRKIEEDCLDIHAVPATVDCPVTTGRQIFVVPQIDDSTKAV